MIVALLAHLLLQESVKDPRLGSATRKDEAGWIELHLAGSPRDIGYQYGMLLAKEIDDAHRARRSQITGKYDWNWYRDTAKSLFWAKTDKEYQQELEGQAEALKKKGYSYDVWDVLAYNANIELADYYIPWLRAQENGKAERGTRESCSAFVATGSVTKDGKFVMGHNLWWDYLMGQRANVLLDIRPEHGNRVVMDAFCGFIHSGTDFAINSAGIALCETTISGFAGFDPKGIPEFVRMRKAIQYSNSLADVVKTFKAGNNGGYANTWLIADLHKNLVGKLELGLKNVTLETTSDGYYVGSNFPENPKLIAEEIPGGWNADPATNSCETRRSRWNSLLIQFKGKVDDEMAKGFLADTDDPIHSHHGATGSTLCGNFGAGGACNTKVVTADMIQKMQMWTRMGFSDGSEMSFKSGGPFLHDIKSQPWIKVGF